MHPEDLGAWRSLWQRAAKQLRVAQGELRIVRADGETRVCRVAFEPILDRNGQLDRISGTVQDVTDVRRLEERMAVRDRELALLAANLPGCIIRMIRHPDGSYAYPLLTGQLADAWHARFGEGLDLDAVLTPEGGGSFREALEAHAAAPGDLEMICSFPARDGELGWLRLTARGRADDAGEVRWTGLLLEITEQRQIAQRLRAAERMESLGTLAGGVAHDFNNALQPLVQYAEYLVGALEGAREREAAQQILDGAHHATGLVRQILTYARDIQGEEPERHALNELVRERVGLVHASMPPAVELVLAVEQRVDVVIDPTHLQQILMNLCSNALHALDGSGRIEVGVRRVSARGPIDTADRVLDAGDWAVLFVCDTGPGIAPEKFSRVLEPFFTTKPPDQGTGLGLSVVHGIAINLGGGIAISNRPEGGACFEVYLPPA
jgi:signal transduction histidine kinase